MWKQAYILRWKTPANNTTTKPWREIYKQRMSSSCRKLLVKKNGMKKLYRFHYLFFKKDSLVFNIETHHSLYFKAINITNSDNTFRLIYFDINYLLF